MFKKLNILRLFFDEPTREFNVREVARLLTVAPATASKELKRLQKANILLGRQERMLQLYKANIESDYYRDIKTFYVIRQIKETGLLQSLNKYYLKPTIILFGSCASGLDTETSDLDLVVISEKTTVFKEKVRFEKKLKREIQLFVVKDITELKNKHLINNILNGIILQGKIQWT